MTEAPTVFNPSAAAPAPTQHNVPEYSVSEIAGAVKRMVEERFGRVRIRGELSAFKVHTASGHAYFRLKDQQAVLDAVCWRGTVGKLPFKPEDGLEVIATGRITTYPGKSSYQIVVEHMEPAGAGALMAMLEKRRQALAAEGLFEASRKKPLPYFPRVIGVVSSPTGAVIRDIIHRIADRFPCRVILWPVAVQGEGAAEQVAGAIHGFNALSADSHIPRPDVLIVARGGGSVEDLWAFNEEIVVRAAASSAIPLISAVGHETDTTLIDFASDKRAPTPTAAAEMATPVLAELRLLTQQLGMRVGNAAQRFLQQKRERLDGFARGMPRPQRLLEHASQRLDDWSERYRAALPALLTLRTQKLAVLSASLRPQLLRKDVETNAKRLHDLHMRALRLIERRLADKQRHLEQVSQLLSSLNYQNVLKRGFALVRGDGGALIASADAAKQQAELSVEFHDGVVKVKN